MKNKSDCESVLSKKLDFKASEEEFMKDIELLNSCGLLPENFYEFPFQVLLFDSTKHEKLTYSDLLKVVEITGKQILEEKERRKKILSKVASWEDWRTDKWELLDCMISYFDILTIEEYLMSKTIENELIISETYSEIRRKSYTGNHDKFMENHNSIGYELFDSWNEFNLEVEFEKPRLIYFRDDTEVVNHKMQKLIFENFGIAYKIDRDYEFIVLNINDNLNSVKDDLSSLSIGEINRNLKNALLGSDLTSIFCVLNKENEVVSSIGSATNREFIEFLEKR